MRHTSISPTKLVSQIRQKKVVFGGNQRLKIYGILQCKSGKRMKHKNRVFFASENEAVKNGFRPCGHCMKTAYKKWIYSITK